jgi:hypothetical protein
VVAQFPSNRRTKLDTLNFIFQEKESSLEGASRQGSTEGSGSGEFRLLGGFGRGNWAGTKLCEP